MHRVMVQSTDDVACVPLHAPFTHGQMVHAPRRALHTSPRIIDVRTAGEYEAGHIEGAVNASFLPPWSWPGR